MSFLDKMFGAAAALRTLAADVDVASAPAPTAGQVLTALDATHARWEDNSAVGGGGAADALNTTGGSVDVSGAAPPTSGQVLTALDDTAAEWADPSWLPLSFYDAENVVVVGLNGDGGLGPASVFMPPSTVLMRADTGDVFGGAAADVAALVSGQALNDSASVAKALFDANTVIAADADNTPHALTMPPSTILTRLAAGNIKAGTAAEIAALLSGQALNDSAAVPLALFDANTVLTADVDNTPHALTMPPSTGLFRLASGAIKAATVAELQTLLGISGSAGISPTLYDANTVLAATADDTPLPVTMPPSTGLFRLASGNIKAATVAELQALLGISVSGGGAITQFAWTAGAATLSLLTSKNWANSATMTVNSTITITNGVEGDYGVIYVKQDSAALHTLAFTVAGRTVLRDANAIDDQPQSTSSATTAYHYQFVTIAGTAYIRLTKVFLA